MRVSKRARNIFLGTAALLAFLVLMMLLVFGGAHSLGVYVGSN